MTDGPFHAGELVAQARAGGGSRGAAIRDRMPDQHRSFFEALPFVVAASVDPLGMPVATLWTGAPGFVAAPDPQTLRIAIDRDPAGDGDPASPAFVVGAPFGLLGIELATRRRNRANGAITAADRHGITVAIHQSFGNCPQYIRPRELYRVAADPGTTTQLSQLDSAAIAAIRGAETCFVATSARTGEPTGGVDVSHRGGPTGFVEVDGGVLTIPDYRGNRYYNTLGNLVSEPRAAVVFVDFARGDLLHVQGTTEIQWDGPEVRAIEGAERLWRLRVEHAWRRPGALDVRTADIR